ncbi:MAG: hypothetical protein KDI71_00360 [Xanthomonadales bacterium]|nr:hypothetical protein [Xanthomonadales bacterium]
MTTYTPRRDALIRPLLGLSLLVTLPASAAFELVDGTADGGGQFSQGSQFSVEGTIGQAETAISNGGQFQVSGGFWSSVSSAPQADAIFSDSYED